MAGVVGLVILLITLLVWRRMEGKEPIKLSGKTVGTVVTCNFWSPFSLALECAFLWYSERWFWA